MSRRALPRLGRDRSTSWAWTFLAPFAAIFLVFTAIPFVIGLALSTVDWRGTGSIEFVGLENFSRLLADTRFTGALVNTGAMALAYIPTVTILAIVLAGLINSHYLRIKGLWMVLLILPHVTSTVAAAFAFKLMLRTDGGIVNGFLAVVGIGPLPWLDDPFLARLSVAALIVWGSLGFYTLLIWAALQRASVEVFEAALCDGCSRIGAFLRITLVQIRPVIVFVITVSIIGMVELYTEPVILTRGGPIASTETISMRTLAAAFEGSGIGYAAAMGTAALLGISTISLAQYFRASRGDEAS